MAAGRKPKPTHLRLLAGNPGKQAINHDEPKPVGDLFDPPEWLTERQKEGWKYAIDNAPMGLLKNLDRAMLTIWVCAEDRHRDAAEHVARFGSITRTPRTQEPMQNPYLAVMNKQASIMIKAGSELGFTPSSRSRISLPQGGSNGKSSAFSQFKRS